MPATTFDESSSGIDSTDESSSCAKTDRIREIEETAMDRRAKIDTLTPCAAESNATHLDHADLKQTALRQIESAKSVPAPVSAAAGIAQVEESVHVSAPPGAYRVIVVSEGRHVETDEDPEQALPDENDSTENHVDEKTFTAVIVDEVEERERLEQATRELIAKSAAQAEVIDVDKRRLVVAVVAILVLVAVITLTALFVERSKSSTESANSTMSPPIKFIDSLEWVEFANGITLSQSELSYPSSDSNSNEERALAWLIEEGGKVPKPFAKQRFAFVVLAFAMNVPEWTTKSGFDECELKGVTCNGNHTAIEIDLTSGKLEGTIPNDIALLSSIRKLVFWDNLLSGAVPWDVMMTHMTELSFFDIDVNELTGTLPNPSPGSWQKLEIFWTRSNNFVGTLSSGFANLPMLRDLYVQYNELTGTVPSELGKITTMEWFAIDYNNFHGSLPTEIGSWTKIIHFEVEGNGDLTGTIPTEVGQWTDVKSFFCHSNKFHGTIPTEMEQLTNLMRFRVHFNDFTGRLPSNLESWSNLEEFHIHNNAFTGPLPQGMSNWTNLVEIKVDINKLTGAIPSDLDTWTDLKTAHFQVNSLTGSTHSFCSVASNQTIISADCCEVSCPCCTSCFTDVNDRNCEILS